MILQTGRFGQITLGADEIITVPQGLFGFPTLTRYCLVDPGDDTLILWLQSLDQPEVAFPILEPKIFKPDYSARLSTSELRELRLENVNQSAVFSILTIPAEITEMSANLKAPLVVNLKEQVAKQVVLQENEYGIKHPMFKELRAHLMAITAQTRRQETPGEGHPGTVITIRDIPPSLTVRSLQA